MLRIILALLMLTGIANAEWDANIPLTGDNLTDFPTDNQENLDRLELVLREYPKGITISYSSASTLVASTGGVVCSDSGGTTKKFRGNTSTTNITFSDIDTGAEASSTTYYVYATCDAVATTASFKVSTSSSAPSGITSYKRIGSFINDSSSNITASSITNDSQWIGHTFGTASSKSVNSAYQATTDGIVYGYNYCDNTGTLTIYSDANASPSTTIGIAACSSSTTSLYIPYSYPVKKGNYYKVSSSGTNVYGSSVNFMPMGS